MEKTGDEREIGRDRQPGSGVRDDPDDAGDGAGAVSHPAAALLVGRRSPLLAGGRLSFVAVRR